MTEGFEAAAEAGRALDHEHILVSRILNNLHFKLFSYSQCPHLDDVGGLEDAQGLLHMTGQDPRGALDCHGLGHAGAQQAVVALQRPINDNGNFSLE